MNFGVAYSVVIVESVDGELLLLTSAYLVRGTDSSSLLKGKVSEETLVSSSSIFSVGNLILKFGIFTGALLALICALYMVFFKVSMSLTGSPVGKKLSMQE